MGRDNFANAGTHFNPVRRTAHSPSDLTHLARIRLYWLWLTDVVYGVLGMCCSTTCLTAFPTIPRGTKETW